MTENLPLQEARLEVWQQERHADLSIRDVFPLSSADSPPEENNTPIDADKEVLPGQVRLLPEHAEIPCFRSPVYLLIFQELDSGTFMAFPFSPYGQPATSGEFRTSLAPEDGPRNLEFRTLCLWNPLILPQEFLESSWNLGFMPPKDLENIRTLRDFGIGVFQDDSPPGQKISSLPLGLQLRIGPRLAEIPARFVQEIHEYLAEEELWKESLMHAVSRELPAGVEVAKAPQPQESRKTFSVLHPALNAWRELLQREGRILGNSLPPGFYAKRLAVWVANVPKAKFLDSAYDPHEPTPVVLLESAVEALSPNQPILHHEDPDTDYLIWKKKPEPLFNLEPNTTMSFFRHIDFSRSSNSLPANKTVLLFDGANSEYMGEGVTAPEGVVVKLLPGKSSVQAPQLVLCAGE